MKLHYMIDFETLALTPDATVLSLGACAFTQLDGIVESKHWNFDEVGQGDRFIDPNTMAWWDKQKIENYEAWKAVFEPETVHTLKEVMQQFIAWTEELGPVHAIWCRGMDFDIPIMQNILNQVELKAPWPYWAKGDTRTAQIGRSISDDEKPVVEGAYHNAEVDAIYQAEDLLIRADKYDFNIDLINTRA